MTHIRKRNIIISGEDISVLRPYEVQKLKADLFKYSQKIKVIVYVRDPISYIQSDFQEFVRQGINLLRIEPFINYFGLENVYIKSYTPSQLYKQDIVEDFSNFLGIFAPQKGARDNASLSTGAVRILYQLNKFISDRGECSNVKNARLRLIEHITQLLPGKLCIPDDLLRGLIDNDDVRWLRDVSGIDFTRTAYQKPLFNEEELHSFLNHSEQKDLDKVYNYLNESCAIPIRPKDTQYLIARYFISFLNISENMS